MIRKDRQKMKKKNSFEEAYSLILDEIINSRLKPGEVITETDLAERLGLSRTPVREALYRFQCEGLINTTNRTKRIFSLTKDDVGEIFELKELIEGQIASKAAENISPGQAEQLWLIVGSMKELTGKSPSDAKQEKERLDRWLSLDRKFHDLLFSAAGNSRARQYIDKLNLQWHRLKVGITAMEGRIDKAITEHEAVGKAVINHNSSEAEKLMTEHLENLKKVLIRLMEAFGY